MEIQIQKSFRKSLSMKVDKNGIVQIKAPLFITKKYLDAFIQKHTDWIYAQQKKLPEVLSKWEIEKLILEAKKYIIPQTAFLAEKYWFSYEKIRITRAQTRWGSCSSRKTLSFSYRLMQYPSFCIDYVIIHELCHLRQMNHSEKFWHEVASIMPNYKDAEKILQHKKVGD